jgi:hypothetical protein
LALDSNEGDLMEHVASIPEYIWVDKWEMMGYKKTV